MACFDSAQHTKGSGCKSRFDRPACRSYGVGTAQCASRCHTEPACLPAGLSKYDEEQAGLTANS
ncbi:MAG: hypothetical protein R6X09_08055 [Bacteroidales bacterium]